MANNVLSYMGNSIGKSIKEDNCDSIIDNIFKTSKKYSCKIIYPEDVVVGKSIKDKGKIKELNESSSSTFNEINTNSKYFKKKKSFLPSLNKKIFFLEKEVQVFTLADYIKKKTVKEIDFMKIDTEGYEFKIFKGIKDNDFKKIKYIYFEHHYDLMINKKYKFSDINNLLIKKNFNKVYKLKMKFRKSFEYIYENKN